MTKLLWIVLILASIKTFASNELQLSYNKTNNADNSTTQNSDFFSLVYGNINNIFLKDFKFVFSNSYYHQYRSNNNYYFSPSYDVKLSDNFYFSGSGILNSYYNDKTTSSNSNYGFNTSLIYNDHLDSKDAIYNRIDLIFLNYYSRENRRDFTFYSTNAFNKIFNENISLLFSLNFGAVTSSDKNYTLFTIGPSFGGQYFANNNLEFHFILGLSRVNYSKRYYYLLINNTYYSELEKVTNLIQKIGTIYRISDNYTFELNASTYRNSSNYTTNSYNGTLFAGKINYRW